MAPATPDQDKHSDRQEELIRRVGKSEERKRRARQGRRRSLWFGLGVIGVIGWSVVIPALLGVLLGAWLNRVVPGNFPWVLVLLLAGLLLGALNAAFWVRKEMEDMARDRQREKDERQ